MVTLSVTALFFSSILGALVLGIVVFSITRSLFISRIIDRENLIFGLVSCLPIMLGKKKDNMYLNVQILHYDYTTKILFSCTDGDFVKKLYDYIYAVQNNASCLISLENLDGRRSVTMPKLRNDDSLRI